jgi:hypothetical protein
MTSPSTVNRCSVSVTGTNNVPAGGGTATLSVAAARECSWSASVDGAWLSIRSGATGQGNGSVEFAAASNPDPAVRRGAVVLNDQRLEVTQAAGECRFSLAGGSATFAQAGGSGRVELRASSNLCNWTAQSNAEWVVVGTTAGRGSADVPFEVRSTSGPPRSATITAGGERFEVNQTEGCAYTIAPATFNAPASGGSGSLSIATAAACPWTVASAVNWLSFSPASGAGPATISFTVAPSGSSSRTGTAVVGDQTFTVTQSPAAAPCSYDSQPRAHSVSATGGTVSVNVSAGPGCAWTASSALPWVTVGSGASGTGNGVVTLNVASSGGATRTGTVTVANHAIAISQAGACAYAISSESSSVPAAGATGKVTVTAANGCTWTAVSNAAWIAITSASSGSGTGDVNFRVDASGGAARSGTLTIAGRTHTVTQGPGCVYTIVPEERAVGAGATTFDVNVSTSAGCTWTASSQAGWITVRERDGTRVEVTVAENTGAARTGTATIAGRTLTVSQAAGVAECRYDVSPTEREIDDDDRNINIEVRTSDHCSWSAESHVLWIWVVRGARGTGDGEVRLYVFANVSSSRREGTVTIAGQTVTIRQDR